MGAQRGTNARAHVAEAEAAAAGFAKLRDNPRTLHLARCIGAEESRGRAFFLEKIS